MKNIAWHKHQITKEERARRNAQKPFIIWLTGLSGAGKSTLAGAIEVQLFNRGHHCYLLDGDNIRHGLSKDLGFRHDDRVENIRRVGEVAKLMVDAGLIVISAFISPYRNEREMVRRMFEPDEFVEIYLDVPLEVCEQRDPKGLYKKARAGEIVDFTGVSSPYESPAKAEITLQTAILDVEACLGIVIKSLQDRNYLPIQSKNN